LAASVEIDQARVIARPLSRRFIDNLLTMFAALF
jgi:hypothetical protein